MTTHAPPRILVDELEHSGVSYDLIRHPPTKTAREEARALHVSPSQVAKTIVLVSPNGIVRAVVPASSRIDLRKVRAILQAPDVRLATEQELAGAYPDFELGAVPPFALGNGDKVIVDVRLCFCDEVLLEAGTHEQSLRLQTSDLLELADASLADICES
ncbi:MAG: YbaK/EbsC family protein [Gaiellaceae bacterium]